MKLSIIAAIAAATVTLAPCAQAKAPSHSEQIANRCMYVAASTVAQDGKASSITDAARNCITAAELTIADNQVNDVYQRELLATNVEQATTDPEAAHAQAQLDAYDQGRVIGAALRD